ncbi:hypothetical protein L596_019424 [Steinernema carpocapsae]|uniref:G-protein coupled receptors family 1 profile domain-containing protein n=1 Tax=Steinernema carpocapsae TaxID=34508 RepID=A0A4U5MR04_STECR|nr:hypothetical protein L596_019424 [Steinernema carpocapsae]
MFHFACWTPFWLSVLLILISTANAVTAQFIAPKTVAFIKLITSFLPYINSAGNWIFYAALNRKIQRTSLEVRRRRHLEYSQSLSGSQSALQRMLSLTYFLMRVPSRRQF